MTRALEAAYSPISAVPTIVNATGTATPVVVASSSRAGGIGGGIRRVRVANVGSAVGGIVWAQTTDADSVITAQTIATSTKLAAGATEYLLISAGVKFGYVGATDFSITISDV